MIDRNEAERLASALNALRADWTVRGLMTILADDRLRVRRSYRDLTVAFSAIAVDPATKTPNRIFEDGPWWEAAYAAVPQARPAVTPPAIDIDGPDTCDVCLRDRDAHEDRWLGHEFRGPDTRTPPVGMPEELRRKLAEGVGMPPKVAEGYGPTPTGQAPSDASETNKKGPRTAELTTWAASDHRGDSRPSESKNENWEEA